MNTLVPAAASGRVFSPSWLSVAACIAVAIYNPHRANPHEYRKRPAVTPLTDFRRMQISDE